MLRGLLRLRPRLRPGSKVAPSPPPRPPPPSGDRQGSDVEVGGAGVELRPGSGPREDTGVLLLRGPPGNGKRHPNHTQPKQGTKDGPH